jgi:hypothetical protein
LGPLSAGFLLTYLARTSAERDAVARELEDRRAFVKQMNDAAGWDQLIDLITSYPGTVTAASNAYFMVQRSPGDEFDLISNWHRAGSGRVQLSPATLLADCEACTARGSADPSAIVTCQREGIDELEEGVNRYCMSLATVIRPESWQTRDRKWPWPWKMPIYCIVS